MNGWVKTYRKIQEHWIWTSKEPYDMRSAWQYLIMNANYAENKILTHNGELLEIGRGQILVSVRNLSEKWKWSVSKVSKFLKRLEDDNMVQRIGNKSGTLLTIVNYSVYQDCENTKDTPNDTQKEHQRYTEQYTEDTPNGTPKIQGAVQNKEYKEDNKDKESKEIEKEKREEDTPPISPSQEEMEDKGKTKKKTTKANNPKVFYPNDEKLNQAFLDFMAMRKSIKKPMTDRAITMAMNKLERLSTTPFSDSMDNDLAIRILEQSTFACWTDLYALKEDRKKSQSGSSLVDEWRNA